MQYSTRFNMNLPELGDQYNLEHWNQNTRKLDEIIPTQAEVSEYIRNALANFYNTRPFSSRTPRWLRFNFDDPYHKSLVIKGGTSIVIKGVPYEFIEDTTYDMTSFIDSGGTDFFVHAYVEEGLVKLVATKFRDNSGVEDSVYIGRFHTLCNTVDVSTTMTMAAPTGVAISDDYLIKPYKEADDPDFYNFYTKKVTAATVGSQYDTITMVHPLAGFLTGSILPESVWCVTFMPEASVYDGMVYDVGTGRAVDIYLQSGTGANTKSVYGAVHTVSRQQLNHADDMMQVGKMLISDEEFSSAALGSNEKTNISGSSDKSTVGGHIDTASRRMISAIGCEEMCGYLWQYTRDVSANGGSGWGIYDGHASFGQMYGVSYAFFAGGAWVNATECGSRCRGVHENRSNANAGFGGRGVSRVIRSA